MLPVTTRDSKRGNFGQTPRSKLSYLPRLLLRCISSTSPPLHHSTAHPLLSPNRLIRSPPKRKYAGTRNAFLSVPVGPGARAAQGDGRVGAESSDARRLLREGGGLRRRVLRGEGEHPGRRGTAVEDETL